MVRRRQRERSLFEVLLPDGHKLWPDWLRRIDTVLEDEAVIEVVAQALEARWPQSRRRGRPGTPAEVVIRMLILKHLFDWSYDDLEQEVRANLVYRAFTRIDAGEVPDAKTILKIAGALGPDVIGHLHRQVVEVAKRAGVTRGRRFRIDTTVVETNVHYPTDSTLLQDGVRVLTRTMATGEYRARRRARSDSQSAAQRHAGRLDDRLSGPLAEDPGRHGAELSEAHGHDARGVARCRHDGPSAGPTATHGARRHRLDPGTGPAASASAAPARPARRRADAGASDGRRHARPGQGPQRLRTAYHDDSEGQDLEAERIREPRDDSGIGASDHHRLRGARGSSGGRHDVDASLGPTSGHLRARAVSRRRRSGLQLGDQRTGRRRPRRATRHLAAPWTQSRRRDARTNVKPGSDAVNAGASDAKGASASLNDGMDCDAVATMAPTAWLDGSGSASSRTT